VKDKPTKWGIRLLFLEMLLELVYVYWVKTYICKNSIIQDCTDWNSTVVLGSVVTGL